MFKDFDKQNPQSWKNKIITDLKGGDYDDLLIWNSDEDISIEPFYTKENRSNSEGVIFQNPNWNIVDSILVSQNKKNINQEILHSLNWGATSLNIDIQNQDEIDFDILFSDIQLDCIELIVTCRTNQFSVIDELLEAINSKYDLNTINFRLSFDVLSDYYKTGKINAELKNEILELKKINSKYSNPNIKLFAVDLRYIQNAGAKIKEQLALGFAIIQYYVEQTNQDCLNHIGIFTSSSSNFFFETSKLRALRKMWAFYSKAYKIEADIWIYSENSTRNKTVFDPYVNMLRTGSETLSGVIGGADSVYTIPFDLIYKKSNEFSRRIARNQQVLIKGESYLDKVADVANGAYYVEHLTSTFEKDSYALFQKIDSEGLISYLESGQLKKDIEQDQKEASDKFEKQEKPLLGTNLYPNKEEVMSSEIEIDIDPFKDHYVPCRRISIHSELERLANEKQQ